MSSPRMAHCRHEDRCCGGRRGVALFFGSKHERRSAPFKARADVVLLGFRQSLFEVRVSRESEVFIWRGISGSGAAAAMLPACTKGGQGVSRRLRAESSSETHARTLAQSTIPPIGVLTRGLKISINSTREFATRSRVCKRSDPAGLPSVPPGSSDEEKNIPNEHARSGHRIYISDPFRHWNCDQRPASVCLYLGQLR